MATLNAVSPELFNYFCITVLNKKWWFPHKLVGRLQLGFVLFLTSVFKFCKHSCPCLLTLFCCPLHFTFLSHHLFTFTILFLFIRVWDQVDNFMEKKALDSNVYARDHANNCNLRLMTNIDNYNIVVNIIWCCNCWTFITFF